MAKPRPDLDGDALNPTIDLLPALLLAVLMFAGTVVSATLVGVLKMGKPNHGPVHQMDHEDPLGAIRMIELAMLLSWLVAAVYLYGPLVTWILAIVAVEFLRSSTARCVLARYAAPLGLGRFARIGLMGTGLIAVASMATYVLSATP